MDQEKAAGKILMEQIELGIIDEKDDVEAYNYILQAIGVGYDIGRKVRSHQKPVGRYSRDGVLLEMYESVAAAGRATQINRFNIANCCYGRYGARTAGGFKWKYIEDGETNDSGEYDGTIGGR